MTQPKISKKPAQNKYVMLQQWKFNTSVFAKEFLTFVLDTFAMR